MLATGVDPAFLLDEANDDITAALIDGLNERARENRDQQTEHELLERIRAMG